MQVDFLKDFKQNIFNITEENFEENALKLFHFQAENNLIYKQFLGYLRIKVSDIQSIREIPFLPIEFFKTQKIYTNLKKPEVIFESSGTTQQIRSKHLVQDLEHYKKVSRKIFQDFFGSFNDYHILALLPSYLERKNASLVFMIQDFIEQSQSKYSGFYLNDLKALQKKVQFLIKEKKRKILIIGVTFALLDWAEKYPMPLDSNVLIMETGGMKGKREELTRNEVHQILKNAFKLEKIYSEYGMTELLSQAYTFGEENFYAPPFFRILLREANDPLSMPKNLKRGVINIIDLANADSCAFIATQDLGELSENSFKVLGRIDNSDIRGCNLLVL